jgi:hypothetical protein
MRPPARASATLHTFVDVDLWIQAIAEWGDSIIVHWELADFREKVTILRVDLAVCNPQAEGESARPSSNQ